MYDDDLSISMSVDITITYSIKQLKAIRIYIIKIIKTEIPLLTPKGKNQVSQPLKKTDMNKKTDIKEDRY